MIVIDALKHQMENLTGSVDKLTETTQRLSLEVALRDERTASMAHRLDEVESDVKSSRANIHALRNWLLSAATDLKSNSAKMPELKGKDRES